MALAGRRIRVENELVIKHYITASEHPVFLDHLEKLLHPPVGRVYSVQGTPGVAIHAMAILEGASTGHQSAVKI